MFRFRELANTAEQEQAFGNLGSEHVEWGPFRKADGWRFYALVLHSPGREGCMFNV